MGRSLTGPEPWPAQARWMTPAVPNLQKAIVLRSYADIDIGEHPPGSNRSTSIDHYLRRARVDEGTITSGKGYWCAAWAGAVWEDAGAEIPDWYADCDEWVKFGKATGQWIEPAAISRERHVEGYAALFGIPGDASHIGIIARWDDYERAIQGNTSSNGYSNNGTLVASKDFPTSGVLGFVRPVARR